MCGICGFSGPPDAERLARMTEVMRSRGPDDQGFRSDGRMNLGSRRLSIIDLGGGRMPIGNEAGDIWVVHNGEIYNFADVRAELEAAGHTFSTRSDTEVIVHLYEELGEAFPHRLNGMFAIALWDARRGRLLLVRDRMGIKPLYYWFRDGQIIFGSEIKSLLQDPRVTRDLDPVALHHYFSFKNVPAPLTIFRGVRTLLPGEMAVWEMGRLALHTYWRIHERAGGPNDPAEAADRLRRLLEDAVRMRLVSDVPVGAYLSGGLDSSSVVALMSREVGGRLKTFALTYRDEFAGKSEDRQYAAEVSRRYGTDHHEYLMDADELPARLEAILRAFDEPFAGVVSTFFLSQLIQRHVKVALSGDGADELFGSYLAHRLAYPVSHFLRLRREGRLGALTAEDRATLGEYADRLDLLADLTADGPEEWHWRSKLLVFGEAQKRTIYTEAMAAAVGGASSAELVRDGLARCTSADPLNRILELDCLTLLPDQVLPFVDRLSMAHSIEVRPPFLDYRIVELAFSLPGRLKIRNGTTKWILREAVRDLVPAGILTRKKEGFLLPVNAWLLQRFRGMIDEILSPARLAQHGLLAPAPVRRLLDEHYGGVADHATRIWTLTMFQCWYDLYLGAGHLPEVRRGTA
jgi:asparagine synthase (glutamine-hydrolysing)